MVSPNGPDQYKVHIKVRQACFTRTLALHWPVCLKAYVRAYVCYNSSAWPKNCKKRPLAMQISDICQRWSKSSDWRAISHQHYLGPISWHIGLVITILPWAPLLSQLWPFLIIKRWPRFTLKLKKEKWLPLSLCKEAQIELTLLWYFVSMCPSPLLYWKASFDHFHILLLYYKGLQ